MRYAYPCELIPQPEGGFTVLFPDVPEAITEADTQEQARKRAEDALVTAISFYTDANEPLPRPSPAHGRPIIRVPPLIAAKLGLHDAMVASGVSNAELARRLGLSEKAVRRLRDPLHRSHIDKVDTALAALGRHLELSVLATG